jgi:hypothetical protein
VRIELFPVKSCVAKGGLCLNTQSSIPQAMSDDESPIMLWASTVLLTRVLLSWAKRITNSKTWHSKQTRDAINQQLTKGSYSTKTWQPVQIVSMKIRPIPK